MMLRLLLILLLMVGRGTIAHAQVNDKSAYNADTLSGAEAYEVSSAYNQTTMSYWQKIDSCSQVGDSLGASYYFLRLSPYQLFAEKVVPDSIGKFISDYHYKITAEAQREFWVKYNKFYLTPKSEVFNRFQQIYDEDQQLRKSLDSCKDMSCKHLLSTILQYSDSGHFDFLYKYVQKHGWPSLEEGSLPATIIAIHDHAHHNFYLPLLKKAVMNGRAEFGAYGLMFYWLAHAHDQAVNVKEYIAQGKYISFDVSELLHGNSVEPSTLGNIIHEVRKHCPVMGVFIFECRENKKHAEFCLEMVNEGGHNVLSLLLEQLADYNCRLNKKDSFSWQHGLYWVPWLPSEREQPKLYFYVLYDRNDSISKPFNKLLTENKWTTHAINFETGKSVIQKEGKDLLGELAKWLIANPMIKLEIDGHTDSVGIAAINQKLSEERAAAVKEMLVSLGINPARLTIKGFGATRPLQPNTTEAGKANNRRVEFIKL